MKNIKDKIRGSIIGGATGDALGYPLEFLRINHIREIYGESGITRYKLNNNGEADITDDTQMTLFTANGLLYGAANNIHLEEAIEQAYIAWYDTQEGIHRADSPMWLTAIDGLYVRRAPGLSCLKGLKALSEGEKVKSESQKGCGGVMRVAPIGLFMAAREEYTIEDATNLGAAAAKITHKGQLGFLPAALLANIIYRLTLISTEEASQNLGQIIRDAMTQLSAVIDKESGKSFGKLYSSKIRAMNGLIDLAFDYSTSELSDFEAISRIGHGKLGNEAIAIAIYCCLRYPSDFERCIIASVNHSGDCDSTGAVTGNIIGAALGWSQIPSHFAERLELLDTLEMIASDLASLEIDSNRYTKK